MAIGKKGIKKATGSNVTTFARQKDIGSSGATRVQQKIGVMKIQQKIHCLNARSSFR